MFRACLETTRGAAARDFGCGQGGEFRASPQRAVRNEPTPATDKRPAARRVFGEKAVWLRPARECFRGCSVVAARSASFVAPSGLFQENSAPRSFQTGSYNQNLDPERCVSITASNAMSYQISHSERFDNPFGHSMFQNPLLALRFPHPAFRIGTVPASVFHTPQSKVPPEHRRLARGNAPGNSSKLSHASRKGRRNRSRNPQLGMLGGQRLAKAALAARSAAQRAVTAEPTPG